MNLAVISDIHSNLEALLVVKEALSREEVDAIYCLGDIVGYNANPVECLQLIRKMNVKSVAGNHDHAAVGLTDTSFFNPHAKAAAEWSAKQLQKEDIEFIQKLPYVIKEGKFTFVHGTLDNPKEWGYIFSKAEAIASLKLQETPICFVGHSHIPFVYQENGEFLTCPEGKGQLDPNIRYIINVGSVGQPRDGNPKTSFVTFDTEKWIVDFHRLDYDFETTQKKVIEAGLPLFLAERLAKGR